MVAEAVKVQAKSPAVTTTTYYGDDPQRITATRDSTTENRRRRMNRVMDKLRILLTVEEQELFLSRVEQAETPSPVSEEDMALVSALSGGYTMTPQETAALEAAAFIQYFQHRRDLLKGALTAQQVADLLGTTRQTPHDRVQRNRLLAVMDRGAWRFPSWQFDPEGPDGVVAGLPDVLQALHVSPLVKVKWLTHPNVYLDQMTPLELVKRGQVSRVLAEARSVGVR